MGYDPPPAGEGSRGPRRAQPATGAIRTRVVTVAFTDLVGSADIKSRLGDRAYASLIRLHDTLLAQAFDGLGVVESDLGDGSLVRGDSPSDVVRGALRFQLAVRRASWPVPVAVRIGVHVGEILELPASGGHVKLTGLAVDVAARLASLAAPGQVLVSRSIFESARQHLRGADPVDPFEPSLLTDALEWEPRGPAVLKGVDANVDVVEVGWRGVSPFTPLVPSEKGMPAQTGRRSSPALRWTLMGCGIVAAAALATLAIDALRTPHDSPSPFEGRGRPTVEGERAELADERRADTLPPAASDNRPTQFGIGSRQQPGQTRPGMAPSEQPARPVRPTAEQDPEAYALQQLIPLEQLDVLRTQNSDKPFSIHGPVASDAERGLLAALIHRDDVQINVEVRLRAVAEHLQQALSEGGLSGVRAAPLSGVNGRPPAIRVTGANSPEMQRRVRDISARFVLDESVLHFDIGSPRRP